MTSYLPKMMVADTRARKLLADRLRMTRRNMRGCYGAFWSQEALCRVQEGLGDSLANFPAGSEEAKVYRTAYEAAVDGMYQVGSYREAA